MRVDPREVTTLDRPSARGLVPLVAIILSTMAVLWGAAIPAPPAKAADSPDATRVLGIRAGSTCLTEQVRVTGFALARDESGATLPFDGYRITDVTVTEGDTVAAGQELVRAVRQDTGMPGAPRQGMPESYVVRAPIAGRVTHLDARVGMVTGAPSSMPGQPTATPARAGQPDPMVRIASPSGTDLLVDVPSPYAARVKVGVPVRILPDGGSSLRGVVRVPVAEVDPRTQFGRARIAVEPSDGLRLGQFASAVIETARDCGLSVPRGAVTYREGVPTVQVLNGSRVETRSIRTGLSDETTIQVREGVAEDEPVIANAGTALRAGDRVIPVITGKVGAPR